MLFPLREARTSPIFFFLYIHHINVYKVKKGGGGRGAGPFGGERRKTKKNKSGIYCLTNKSTPLTKCVPQPWAHTSLGERSDFYIGQSSNLSARFRNYYNVSYLASKGNLIICRALIKYGYSNFSSPPPPSFRPPPSHLPYILDLNKINFI